MICEVKSKMKHCENCVNSRVIVSEYGYSSICTLSPTAALNCIYGTQCRFSQKNKITLRVFISVGMNGRDHEEITADLTRADENIRKFCTEEYDIDNTEICIIDNYKCEPSIANPSRLWYLGEAIKKLGLCDVCYFVKGWQNHKGCIIEMEVCKLYGIKIVEESE